jgi:hypothetical protein
LNRTLANVRSDLGSTSNTLQTLVLRDNTNGGFTAGTITATGFVGYGGGITGLDANNLSSGAVPTGRLSGTYNINVTGSAASTTGSLTFKTDGLGATAVSFNGSINRDISYNSIGAPSQTGALASGTQWNISILGNAATVTNGVTTSRNISTTSGITGGGNLGSDLTLGAVAGTGIVVNSVGIHVNTTSVVMATSGSSQTVSGVKTFENRPVLNSGLSIKNTATTSVSGFAVFSGDPTAGTAFTVDYRSIGNIRSDLGTSTNTADRLVLRDSNGDFASRYISVTGISGVQTVGSMTSVYTSTSISGLNNTTYLANFIIDGGTP